MSHQKHKGSPGPRDMERAVRAFAEGRLEDAEAAFRRVVAAFPNQPDALHFLGLVRAQRGDDREAIALVERATSAAPGYVDAHNNLGNLYLRAGAVADAERRFRKVIELAPQMGAAHFNLGVLLSETSRAEEAIGHLRMALAFQPGDPEVLRTLGDACRRARKLQDAAAAYEKLLELAPGAVSGETFRHLARVHVLLGDRAAGVRTVERWLAAFPDDALAAHMHAAYGGRSVPDRAADEYVRDLFDGFSETFDSTLDRIGYQPRLIAEAAKEAAASAGPDVLDAGCGTGKCGAFMRPWAGKLIGVDLSPKMLDKARALSIYDELLEGEVTAHLRSKPSAYDVVVCADLFVYFGSLQDFFDAASASLRPGGSLVFSVELAADPASPFQMNVHGRYAHGAQAVQSSLERSGFRVGSPRQLVLRRENDADVAGAIFTASLPAAGPP